MNKDQLIQRLSRHFNLTRSQSEAIVTFVLDETSAALCKGEKVSLTGFGSFERRVRKARKGRNPSTGESLALAESPNILFKPGTHLKHMLLETLND